MALFLRNKKKTLTLKRLALFLIILSSFSSCVTLFNRKKTHIYVKSNPGAKMIYHKEYEGVKLPGEGIVQPPEGTAIPIGRKGVCVMVKRDRYKRLPVTVEQDGVEKTVQVKPVHSMAYYWNFAHLYPLLGVGFLIDHNNPNRFGYPGRVYVDTHDTLPRYYAFIMPEAGMLRPKKTPYFTADIAPLLGNVVVYDLEHLRPAGSPFYMSASLNYHYKPHRFVSVGFGGASVVPIRGHIYRDSVSLSLYGLPHYESKKGFFADVRDNRSLGRLELGYGLSAGWHEAKSYYGRTHESDSVVYTRAQVGLGASFAAYYRLFSFLSFGTNFQPQFIAFDHGVKFSYEYLWSMGLRFRIGRNAERPVTKYQFQRSAGHDRMR